MAGIDVSSFSTDNKDEKRKRRGHWNTLQHAGTRWTYLDGGGPGHVVHERQFAETAGAVVAADLPRLVVRFGRHENVERPAGPIKKIDTNINTNSVLLDGNVASWTTDGRFTSGNQSERSLHGARGDRPMGAPERRPASETPSYSRSVLQSGRGWPPRRNGPIGATEPRPTSRTRPTRFASFHFWAHWNVAMPRVRHERRKEIRCRPVDDVEIVAVVALSDDVVAAADGALEHGVQHFLHLLLEANTNKQTKQTKSDVKYFRFVIRALLFYRLHSSLDAKS